MMNMFPTNGQPFSAICRRNRHTNDEADGTFSQVERALDQFNDCIQRALEDVEDRDEDALNDLKDRGNHVADAFDDVRHTDW